MFLNSLQNNINMLGKTENNAVTLRSTLNPTLDLFFKIGSIRKISNNDNSELFNLFNNSFNISPEMTLRMLFYIRDIRGGQGERNAFRVILKHFVFSKMYNLEPRVQRKSFNVLYNLCKEYGRIDDYIDVIQNVNFYLKFDKIHKLNIIEKNTFINNSVLPITNIIVKYITNNIKNPNSSNIKQLIKNSVNSLSNKDITFEDNLLFKWIPRQEYITRVIHNKVSSELNKKYISLIGLKKTKINNKFNNEVLLLSRKEFRKLIVRCSNTVEQKVHKKEYSLINLSNISSLSMKRHLTNFKNNIPEQLNEFFKELKNGNVKVNADTLFPYDVYNTYINGDSILANAQWENLPNYFNNEHLNILPVIDVSGSMTIGKIKQSPISIAITLGMYLAERNTTNYKNKFVTFESEPNLLDFSQYKNFVDKLNFINSAPWGGSTNIYETFKIIVDSYKNGNTDVPGAIIIFSDMEFDECGVDTNFNKIKKLYDNNGIKIPKLIFWNINSRTKENYPINKDENNVILVGGFSPSTLKNVIKLCNNTNINPVEFMEDVLLDKRYDKVIDLLNLINGK